jgi:hypothetical protein
MALAVEDGTGLAGAEAYVSLSDADAYFTARGASEWTGTSDAKEAALRRGCQYLENVYRARWKGYRVKQEQALAWPRCNSEPLLWFSHPVQMRTLSMLVDVDGFPIQANEVPRQVKSANCEAALLAVKGVTLTTSVSAAVTARTSTVGPVSKSVQYAGAVTERDQRLLVIDDMLIGLLISAPGATFGNIPLQRG